MSQQPLTPKGRGLQWKVDKQLGSFGKVYKIIREEHGVIWAVKGG